MNKPPLSTIQARIHAAATRPGRASNGEFSLEGTRLLERALRAGVTLTSVLVGPRYGEVRREAAIVRALEENNLSCVRASKETMRALIGNRTFGDVIALANLPQQNAALSVSTNLLVAVDIQDPGNTGALVRTAAAAGAGAVLCLGTSDAYHPKAVRTSMGAVLKTPIFELETRDELWELLDKSGHTKLGSVVRGGLEPWSKKLPETPSAVFVGSEPFGLDDEILASCDHRVTLPQSERLDSYSVNAATAMLFYELQRRKLT